LTQKYKYKEHQYVLFDSVESARTKDDIAELVLANYLFGVGGQGAEWPKTR